MKHIVKTTKKHGIVGILLFVFRYVVKKLAHGFNLYSPTTLIYQLTLSYEDRVEVEDKPEFFIYDAMNNFLFRGK